MIEQAIIIDLLNRELSKRQLKNPLYSMRRFARMLGVSPATISETLNGKRRLSQRTILKLVAKLSLDPSQKHILLHKLTGPSSRKKTFQQSSTFLRMGAKEFEPISEWYYFAILSLSETSDFSPNPHWIAKRLNIRPEQAKRSLHKLFANGYMKRGTDGKVEVTHQIARVSNSKDPTLTRYNKQGLRLAAIALDESNEVQRAFSSMTMAIDIENLPAARDLIRRFRHELSNMLEHGNKTEVYRLGIQLFPLSESVQDA